MTIHKKNGLSIRIAEDNPNHHLYRNNGGWWVHYTIYPSPVTTQRVRRSLGTRSISVARSRRDAIFVNAGCLAKEGSHRHQVPAKDQSS